MHETLGERESAGGQEARSGIGQLLHPRREMGGLAHRGVVHAEVGANGPDNHLARVQADADTDGDPLLASYPLGVSLHALLHPERRVARAHRVVLMCDRRAEQRHDAVAHDLIHGALVAVDGLHHPFEDWIEDLARLFRVAVGEQLHRAFQVGKEDSYLLPLAFQRGL